MRTLTLAAALSLISLMAQAASPRSFNDRRPLNADATLTVRNSAGMIEVEAWDKAEFDLVALLGDSAEKIEISGSSSALLVEVRNLKSSRFASEGETRLKLRVPAGLSLTLDGTSADVRVRGVHGPLTARTVSGEVHLAVAARQITVQTVSGDVQLDTPQARALKLNTVSGDTEVQGAGGALAAESVSGNVTVQGGSYTELELKTISGDISVQASFAPAARVKAESLSGDVQVKTPAGLSAQVTMKTMSGDRHSDFEGVQQASDSRRKVIKIGEGRGQFALSSFSGDVSLDRQ